MIPLKKVVVQALFLIMSSSSVISEESWDDRFYTFPGPSIVDAGANLRAPGPIAPWSLGEFLIGGRFTNLAGVEVLNLAKWNGSNWVAPLPNRAGEIGIFFSGPNDNANGIHSIATWGSDILIGGRGLTNAGGVSISNVALWDGTKWNDLNGGTTGLVSAVTIIGNKFFAGGNFTEIGGVATTNIAETTGEVWEPLGEGLPFVPDVLAAHERELYAAGMAPATATGRHGLLRWTGTEWVSLSDAFPAGQSGRSLALLSTPSGLYVGGIFSEVSGVPARNIALWTGTEWKALGAGLGGRVDGLIEHRGKLIAAGRLWVGSVGFGYGLASWDGTNWTPVQPGTVIHARSIATSAERILTRGKVFTPLYEAFNGTAYFDREQWRVLGAGFPRDAIEFNPQDPVKMSVDSTGVYLSAMVRQPGTRRPSILKWDDTNWTILLRENNKPRSYGPIAPQGQTLWVGADYQGGGVGAYVNSNSVTAGLPRPGPASALAVQGSKVYAGGNFGLALWNGHQWTAPFLSVTNAVQNIQLSADKMFLQQRASFSPTLISSMEGQNFRTIAAVTNLNGIAARDGLLYAYGGFTNIGGKSINLAAVWNGTEWNAVAPFIRSNAFESVTDVSFDGRGGVLLSGFTRLAGDTNIYGVVQVSNGQARGLDTLGPPDLDVHQAEWWRGALYVAGQFGTLGENVESGHFGAWHDPEAAVEGWVLGPTNVVTGQSATIQIQVLNLRETNITDVEVILPLPMGVTMVEGQTGPTHVETNVVWTLGNVGPGETNLSVQLRFDFTTDSDVLLRARVEGQTIPTFDTPNFWLTASDGNKAPTVALSGIPTSITIPTNVTLRAEANDADGTISRVDFYDEEVLIGSDTQAPYEVTWSPAQGGNHFIRAAAYDDEQKQTFSLRWTVLVQERPSNDNFADRLVITNRVEQISGTILEATAEPNDPAGFGGTVWYEWQPGEAGIASISISPAYRQVAVFRETIDQPPAGYSDSNNTLPIRLKVAANERLIIVIGGRTPGGFSLDLTLSPLKANDYFSNAEAIEGWEIRQEVDTFGGSAEPGEPAVEGQPATTTLWYSWTAPMDGRVVLERSLIALGFLQGTNLASLQPVPVTQRDPGLPPGWPDYPVEGGKLYYLQADKSPAWGAGWFDLNFVTQGGRIRDFTQIGGGLWRMDFRGYDYTRYDLEKSKDLENWEPFLTLTNFSQGTVFQIPAPDDEPAVFWRTRYVGPHQP